MSAASVELEEVERAARSKHRTAYYARNKEHILAQQRAARLIRKEITCVCGAVIDCRSWCVHRKTNGHVAFIEGRAKRRAVVAGPVIGVWDALAY